MRKLWRNIEGTCNRCYNHKENVHGLCRVCHRFPKQAPDSKKVVAERMRRDGRDIISWRRP